MFLIGAELSELQHFRYFETTTTEAPVLKVFKINFEFDVLIKKNKISGLI
jgi:hypothetical protein